jgi:sugar lactone lactonase YvrE
MIRASSRGILVSLILVGCADADPGAQLMAPSQAELQEASFPEIIPLPAGFSPEGIVIGSGTDFYVGSLQNGAIYKGDLRTGAGETLAPGEAGTMAVGLAYDPRTRHLFVSGGFGGDARVYDATTGALIRSASGAGAGFLNDVVVTRTAAYFTDSFSPALYRLPLGGDGTIPEDATLEAVPLGGDFTFVAGAFNANGIEVAPGGGSLLVVNSETGTLYRVDPGTGEATALDLGQPLTSADGLVRSGPTLYVVQNFLNQIAEVHLAPDLSSGEVVGFITSPYFRIPTTADVLGHSLYAVNARFDVAPPGTPNDVEFEVVRVSR